MSLGRRAFVFIFFLIGCKEENLIICKGKDKDIVPFPNNCSGVEDGKVSIIWEFTPSSSLFSLPLSVGDVDGDRKTEVIVEASEMYYVLNGEDGSILWKFRTEEKLYFFGLEQFRHLFGCAFSLIGELDCDGKYEICAICGDEKVYAFNGENGSILYVGPSDFIPLSMGDINRDGRDEIIGLLIRKWWKKGEGVIEERRIGAVNGKNGSFLWVSEPMPPPTWRKISIGELNGDGITDVVVGCGLFDFLPCGLLALNGKNGSLLWSYTYPEKDIGAVMSPPVLGDLDEDGKLEVVAVTYGHEIYAFNGEDGSLLWHREDSSVGGEYYSIALAKVKGKFRIIGHGGVVLNERGDVIFDKSDGAQSPYYPIIGDANGDGRLDTIVYKVDIIFEDEKNYNQLKIYTVDIEEGSENLLYEGEKKMEVEEIRDSILGDVNNDCILDLVVSITTDRTGVIKVITLSLGVPVPPPHLLPWPMARHDVKRTSLYTGDPYPPW